ncbi:site-specific integrase [Mucilaginibacter ginsenosidivorax]|uniref:Tyrosine-type recombinase/integrase n=1 Tax=Mucilaginibacter ginsenosidivorax TaxID=862126 RepID=A0A5B8W8N3_9SPHI|nr:site-specific integrase [Mucilaginibacter ginsenosidivorax]QEC79326.1 tyrosine-type recombinase/integrase [Mucilaginibacter ginsenosidivorax]
MASIKVMLRARENANGEYPIVIRVVKDRKNTLLSVGHSVKKTDWDEKNAKVKKSHSNSTWLNNLIAKRVAEANDKLIQLEVNNTDTSARVIGKAVKAAKDNTFFKQADLYIARLEKSGNFNRTSAEKPRIKRVKEFLNNRDIHFPEIDATFLKDFKAWLKGTRTITERTAVNHLVVIRSIYNQAIADKLVDPKYYPFGKGGIVIKFPDSKKSGLMPADIVALENVELTGVANHARNLWLFAFYCGGMRASDVLRLKWSDFEDGRLYYTMGKNEKGGSLKISAKIEAILAQYRRENPKHNLVFPDLEKLVDLKDKAAVQEYIKVRIKANNKHMLKATEKANVNKQATSHKSRHSFAQMAKGVISASALQEIFRHSDLKTTEGYMGNNFVNEEIDSAMDDVMARLC